MDSGEMDDDNIQEGGGKFGNFREAFGISVFGEEGGWVTDLDKNEQTHLSLLLKNQLESLRTTQKDSKHILFLRHGISEANELNYFNKAVEGFTHPFLTPEGRLQAVSFGYDILSKILEGYDNVEFYSSTLPRACETIQLISHGLIKYMKELEDKQYDPFGLNGGGDDNDKSDLVFRDNYDIKRPDTPVSPQGVTGFKEQSNDTKNTLAPTPSSPDLVSSLRFNLDLSEIKEKTITRINGISEIPVSEYIKNTQRSISEDELFYVTQYLNLVVPKGGLKFNDIIENSPRGDKAKVNNLVDEYSLYGKGLKRKQYMTTDETFKQFAENMHTIFVEKPDKKTLHVCCGHGMLMMEKLVVGTVIKNHSYLDEYEPNQYNFDELLTGDVVIPDGQWKLTKVERSLAKGSTRSDCEAALECHQDEKDGEERAPQRMQADALRSKRADAPEGTMQGGGAAFNYINDRLEKRKENKERKKDIEKKISDEALKYILKIFNMKVRLEKEDDHERMIKELFKIIQFSGKKGIEITKPINHKLYVNPDAVKRLIEQFKGFVEELGKEFKKLYAEAGNYIDKNWSYVNKIHEGVETEADELRPPNLCAVLVEICESNRIEEMNRNFSNLFNGNEEEDENEVGGLSGGSGTGDIKSSIPSHPINQRERKELTDYEQNEEEMDKAKKERDARWAASKAEKEEIKAKKLQDAKKKLKERMMEGMKPETELKKLTEYGDPEKKLLEYFETYHGNYKQYYGGRLLNPKNNNFWNLCLLFLCKYVEFITPSTKAYAHSEYGTWNQEFLNENPSMRSFVDSIGKKDALGQMKHNTKDLRNAIEDTFMKKQRELYTEPNPQRSLTPPDIYKEKQELYDTLTKRDEVVQNDGYADYRANMRRLRKKASNKIKSGFSSLKKSLSKRFGRNQGDGEGGGRRRRRKTYRKNKKHYKKRKSKKKHKKHTRRP